MHPSSNFPLIIFFLVQSVQFYSTSVIALNLRSPTTGACKCMDYWDCLTSDGQVYSYCGISETQVCCFFTRNSKIITNTSAKAISTFPSSAGNENPPMTTDDDDFVYVSSTLPTTEAVTSSSSDSSTLPDVDYFYSLESGDDDLKQIITTEASTSDVCGKQAINWKLDSKAEFKEWPWHVALLEVTEDVYICGGALISPSKVVSASHCVKSHVSPDAPKLKVRVGEYDITTNSEGDPYFEVLVEKIVMHPNFNNATLANDIAVLLLQSPLNYSMNVRPICLPSHNNDDSGLTTLNGQKIGPLEQCVVTGWGRPSENSSFSVLLKEIVVPLWNHSECQEKLRKNFGQSYNLPETAICAGERDHDACDGDGGGPLSCFREEKGQWELVGIVSFGIGCGRMDNPGVYTNVLQYVQWLNAFN